MTTLCPSFLELGTIKETLFFRLPLAKEERLLDDDELKYELLNFCIDSKGDVRKGSGMVAYSETSEWNPDYVPNVRYSASLSPWNSHDLYIELELPNPAEDMVFYQLVRKNFLAELGRRVDTFFS